MRQQTPGQASLWARFAASRDDAAFWSSWLAILCLGIDGAQGGLLLLDDGAGGFTPAAIWPDASHDLQHLAAAATAALTERRGVVLAGSAGAQVGYPLVVDGVRHGAVVLDLASGSDAALQEALRRIHWASAWPVDHLRAGAAARTSARLERLATVTGLVATAVGQDRWTASLLAVANELAARLGCARVAIGTDRGGSVVLHAISNTATFDKRTALARAITDAMEEVLDGDEAIVFPPGPHDLPAPCHVELAKSFGDSAVCSVPLLHEGSALGVITLERTEGTFPAETVELCRAAGEMLGPVLALKRESEQGALRRIGAGGRRGVEALFGPRHPGTKMLALLAVAVVAALALVSSTWRISARTVVEGAVQRAVVAPFDGHVAQSLARAGDTVKAGQVLSRLDDRDLQLERVKLSSEREQLLRRHRQALAGQDRAAMVVLAAQLAQAEAQLSLIDDKLARATLVAPFDGVVVTGDLSQLLGAPVETGKVLFQVAPLDAYRVILDVDERDIASVRLGQQGELALSGLPHETMAFEVRQITSIATQGDGRNFFRVEAKLADPGDRVRPGMEGVGKIEVERRNLLWIWTHPLTDWVRLQVWKLLP